MSECDDVIKLHAAVRTGNLQDVMELLARGVDFEVADFLEVRPVHIAAEYGYLDILNALIARGCNVNAETHGSYDYSSPELFLTPLHLETINACGDSMHFRDFLTGLCALKDSVSRYGVSPLHLAAQNGHLPVVMSLVSANANVNAQDNDNATPLFVAVAQNFEDVAKFLIQNGASVNVRDSERLTPLHFAASKGYVDIAKLLVENNAKINAKTLKGFTPLHVAIQNSQAAVSQFLINSGADVNVRDECGRWTPLHNAAYSGLPEETVRLLIARCASVDTRDVFGRTPLHLAAEKDFTEIVNILIKNKASVNVTDDRMWTPLHSAAFKGNLDTLKILTASGGEVNAKTDEQTTPLHFAVASWNVEVVKHLLAKGAEVNATNSRNWTPLHFAADDSATLRKSGHCGAQDSKLNNMRTLIENGADINAKGRNNETAFHVAVISGNPVVVRFLLENGAYYDAKPVVSEIAENVNAILCVTEKLFQALKGSECAEIEKYVQEGAPVNCRSIKYGTPLMYASWKGHLAAVNVLLDNGADVNLSNSTGITPLHYAAKFGHYEILCALLQHGAVYNARTKTVKKTPLHFAHEAGKKEVRETLKLIECMFIKVSEKDDTVLKELNELKGIKLAEFLAIKNCKNVNKESLPQIASKNGCEELCKLFCDL